MESYRRRSRGWQNDEPAYIHPRILFGAGISIDPEFVNKHEISHVVNCAFQEDSPKWFRTTFPNQYVCIAAVDSLDANILDWYDCFEKTVNKFLQDPNCKSIYIHCQCGINRSGFLALLYACKRLGYRYADVVDSILSQRPCALTNPTFHTQVKRYLNV
jgi:protein-tyrosine phosphatase